MTPVLARRASAAALLSLSAATLVGCGSGSRSIDDVVPAAPGTTIDGAESVVQLPHGRLTLVVSDAAEVDDSELASSENDPGDAVGVDWTWEPGAGVPSQQTGFTLADDVPAEVEVVMDGETFDLGPAYSTSDGAVSAEARFVPAESGTTAGDVRVEVAFDGLVQTVRGDGTDLEAGVAAPLYEAAVPPQAADCALAVSPVEATASPVCEVAVVSLPWVTGLGWAEAGGSWTIVDTSVRLEVVTVDGDQVPVAGQTETVQLDGADPTEVLLADGAGATLRTQSVFATAPSDAGELDLGRAVQVDLPEGPLAVTLTGTVDVPLG